jgi:hypothetical protein
MRKLNNIKLFIFILFISCRGGNEKKNIEFKDVVILENKFDDTLTSSDSSTIIILDTLAAFTNIQGIWQMYKYYPTIFGKKTLDTNIILNIIDNKLVKIKKDKIIDSTKLNYEYDNPRILFYWEKTEDRYIRYVPSKDILILNLRGLDGEIEHYKRIKK